MIFRELLDFTGIPYFLLKCLVALIFLSSGWSHAAHYKERSKSIEQSPGFTLVLGIFEIIAPIALVIGFYTQIAALILMIIMVGAIYKKAFVWKTGFWGKGQQGWHYDLLLFLANALFFTTGV